MLSLLKMDIRRMLKSKYFYISILIFTIILGICIRSQSGAQVEYGFQAIQTEHEIGISNWIDFRLYMPLHIIYGFASKYIMLIFGSYMVTFVCSEYNSGYIKNSCMMYKNRNMIILNKVLVSFFLSIVVTILSYVVSTVFGFLFIDGFEWGNLGAVISYMGIMIIQNVALFSLLTFVSTLTRNKTVGILLTFIITTGLSMIVCHAVFDLLHISDLSNYTISQLYMSMPMYYDSVLSMRVLVGSIGFIILYTVLSILVINHRDI